ncbi:hypothetical protein [Rahnella sp. PCH160]|uniref:hypothetical protein n=1 Tax=Rahnella sp. PCH160 TaxID=3447928 RepID=UPI0039FD5E71
MKTAHSRPDVAIKKPARRPAESDDRFYLRFFFQVSDARNAERTTTIAQHNCRSIFRGTLNPSNISSGTINRQLMRKHHSAALLRALPVNVSSPIIPLHNSINDMVLSTNLPARRRASVFFQHAFEASYLTISATGSDKYFHIYGKWSPTALSSIHSAKRPETLGDFRVKFNKKNNNYSLKSNH